MYYQLETLAHTHKLSQIIARVITANFVVALNGDLGTGKTTLIREILKELGVKGSIKSPTFTYVEPYKISNINIYHFDLYRFSDPEEWFNLGFEDYFIDSHICFIEWAERLGKLMFPIDWQIDMRVEDEIHSCQIKAYTNKGQECLRNLTIKGANLFV